MPLPQSLAQIYVHLIFSTKNRVPVLKDETRLRLHEYMGGILRGIGSKSIEINSMPRAFSVSLLRCIAVLIA